MMFFPSCHRSLAYQSVLAVMPVLQTALYVFTQIFLSEGNQNKLIASSCDLSCQLSCDEGIIFPRSYLGFVKQQGVSCEQSSFGH